MLIDTSSNTKIVYLFVKAFEWTNPNNKELSLGHPKPGRVYRSVKNTDSESYRIFYPINNTFQGTYVSLLKQNNAEAGYTSDIQEITLENILDFDITEEDLGSFLKWIDSDNDDLKNIFKSFFEKQTPLSSGGIPQTVSKKRLIEIVVEALRTRDPELASIVSVINDLRDTEPQIYASLGLFVNRILDDKEEATPVDNRWIRFDKNLGAGANISSALQKLSSYSSADRRKNFSEEDLLGAIKDLFFEVYRRKFYESQ